jgi:hypothetical protein
MRIGRKSWLAVLLLAGMTAGCSQLCPVPDGCGPVSHDPHRFDSHNYDVDLIDATNGRIVSGYSDIDVTIHMSHGRDETGILVSPRGEFGLITPGNVLATGITVKAFGYEPYSAEIGENERKLIVKLQPVTAGEYVRYSGVVTDATTGKGVQIRAARLLYDEMRYRMIYVYGDGTFDFLANSRYPPARIAIMASGYLGYDGDLAPGKHEINIALRPVDGSEAWLGGVVSEVGNGHLVPPAALVTGRVFFSDGTSELLWINPDGAYRNAFTLNANRAAREVVVTAAGYETFRADLPPGLGQFDIGMRRLNSQPTAGQPGH